MDIGIPIPTIFEQSFRFKPNAIAIKNPMINTSLNEIKKETLYDIIVRRYGERIKKLSQAIETLPPKCKEAFKLSKFENHFI